MASSVTTTVFLNPGESVVLPAGAQIDSIIADGDIIVTSSCDEEVEQDTYVCMNYSFGESESAGGALGVATIESIEVGGTVYEIGYILDGALSNIIDAINAETGVVFYVYSGAVDDLENRKEYALGVKIPSLLVDTVKFKITGDNYLGGLLVLPVEVEDCACVTQAASGDATSSQCDEV